MITSDAVRNGITLLPVMYDTVMGRWVIEQHLNDLIYLAVLFTVLLLTLALGLWSHYRLLHGWCRKFHKTQEEVMGLMTSIPRAEISYMYNNTMCAYTEILRTIKDQGWQMETHGDNNPILSLKLDEGPCDASKKSVTYHNNMPKPLHKYAWMMLAIFMLQYLFFASSMQQTQSMLTPLIKDAGASLLYLQRQGTLATLMALPGENPLPWTTRSDIYHELKLNMKKVWETHESTTEATQSFKPILLKRATLVSDEVQSIEDDDKCLCAGDGVKILKMDFDVCTVTESFSNYSIVLYDESDIVSTLYNYSGLDDLLLQLFDNTSSLMDSACGLETVDILPLSMEPWRDSCSADMLPLLMNVMNAIEYDADCGMMRESVVMEAQVDKNRRWLVRFNTEFTTAAVVVMIIILRAVGLGWNSDTKKSSVVAARGLKLIPTECLSRIPCISGLLGGSFCI